jgi:hypothetical protein
MITPAKPYDLAIVEAAIGSNSIGGYGAEGGMVFEQAAQVGEFTIGATGFGTFVVDNNNLVLCTITVQPHTQTYRLLATALENQLAQMKATGQIAPLPFFMFDPTNGDTVSEPFAVFTQRPNPSKVKALTDMEFQIGLPNAADQMIQGPLNILGG